MKRVRLAAPYLDTSADHLAFSLTAPVREALAVNTVRLGGVSVELRLLGASHQVVAGPVTETLACLPDQPGGGPPPADITEDIDGWAYRFTSALRCHEPREFPPRAARLRERLAAHPASLYGAFPGSPDALSALTAQRVGDVISWQTWHVYPQSGQIVETRTTLRPPHGEAPHEAEQKNGGGASAQPLTCGAAGRQSPEGALKALSPEELHG
ncbi:DUF2617 family protein [Streptomyces specialis]|uniref:DUF2617 family protein n=1 Tax=Streptomyces specialis TaxID=498367 RepID=UPI000A79E279|nr:DUF2617 family protein [Streptomyces specialis]